MTNEVTYTSLLNDDKFLDDAYYALRAQGINVSTQRKDILDRFLTNKRYFDTNIASTFVIGDEVKKMSDQDKKAYADAVTKVEQLPTIGKAGAAPTSDLIKDYLVAGVTDPTNLISILAGAFTFGAGGAAIQAGKETAKQGVKKLVKNKVKVLTQSQKNKALAKTLIAEGAIAGTGGVGQNLKAQEVDMAIGRREPGKYNVGEALAQGAIEGLASPVAGVALAGIGKAGVTGVKKVGSLATRTKSGEQAAQYINRMKNYLLPFGGVDDITQRNFERGRAIFKDIKGETENLIDAIRIEEQRFLKADDGMNVPEKLRMTVEDKRNLVNSAMENDTAALRSLEEKDAGMYNVINDFVKLRKKVYKRVFKYTDPQSDKIQNIYKIDPEQYTKNVADRAKKDAGIPFLGKGTPKFLENSSLFNCFWSGVNSSNIFCALVNSLNKVIILPTSSVPVYVLSAFLDTLLPIPVLSTAAIPPEDKSKNLLPKKPARPFSSSIFLASANLPSI